MVKGKPNEAKGKPSESKRPRGYLLAYDRPHPLYMAYPVGCDVGPTHRIFLFHQGDALIVTSGRCENRK